MSTEDDRRSRPRIAIVSTMATISVFFAFALLSLWLSTTYGPVASLWPASAFAAVVIRRNPRIPVAGALVGIAFATFLACFSIGTSFVLSAALALAEVLEIGAGLAGLAFLGERRIDRSIKTFIAAFVAVGLLAPLVGASVGAAAVSWIAGGDYARTWYGWWTGNAMGAALVMPVAASATLRRLQAVTSGRGLIEATGLTLTAAIAVMVTVMYVGQPNLLMTIPVMVAAIRLDPLAAGTLGAMTLLAIMGASFFGSLGGLENAVHGTLFGPWAAGTVVVPYCISLLIDELGREREKIAASERRLRVTMDRSPFGMALLDLSGSCYACNRALCELLGYETDELVGLHPSDITYGEGREEVARRFRQVLAGEIDEYALEKQFLRKDGTPVWVFTAVSLVRDERTDQPLYFIAQLQDISARKAAEAALEESESRWNFALESAGQGVWDHDYRRRETFYSPMWAKMLGYPPNTVPTETDAWLDLVHPKDLPHLIEQERIHLAGQSAQFECVYRMRHKDGRWLWILDRGKVIARDADGQPLRMIGTHTDITENRLLTEALEEEKERLRITLHSIGDGVICTDATGFVTFMNPIAEQLTGWSAKAALGRPVEIVFHIVVEGEDRPFDGLVDRCLDRLTHVSQDEGLILVGREGTRVDVKASASPVRTPSGEVFGAVLVFQDVTRARTLQKELAQMASQDALTGLPNRTTFEHVLSDLCGSSRSGDKGHALCFLDLDRFKIINDTAGHAAGDVLLREVGRVIRELVRRHDHIARLGGDEFGIVLVDCALDDACSIAERLLERIGRVRFSWDGRVYEVGASIGIARIDGDTPLAAEVMTRADVACYAAKAAGRNRLSIYNPSEGDARRHHADLHTAAGIRAALDSDRFVVHAQEIIDLRPSGHLQRHCELLVRMRDETSGQLLSPGAFIPAAERYGLMSAIDRWVVRRVLHHFGEAILATPRLAVSINLSANSLESPGLVDFLIDELQHSALPSHRVRFEITETSLINNLTYAAKLVASLRAAGYAIMIDDFGAGVSSFAYLEHFPADYLKIDGGFVRKMKTNPIDRAIVESINDIGHKIGAVTVAEFVEDAETLDILRGIGVDMAQGYHIARPIPLEDLIATYRAADTRLASGFGT